MRDLLFIFDCDGVLVDSETISCCLLRKLIEEIGGRATEGFIYETFLGRSPNTIAALIYEHFEVEVSQHRLDRFQADIISNFEADLVAIPGIELALKNITGSICVASSSNEDRIHRSLELTGIRQFFGPYIFSATMVARGKPNPDLFQLAAQSMGYTPDKCVVIEDSVAGLQAAKAANMCSIGFTGGTHAEVAGLHEKLKSLDPNMIISDMSTLPQAIKRLNLVKDIAE